MHDLSSSTYAQNAEKLSALSRSICASLNRSDMPSSVDAIYFSEEGKHVHDLSSSKYVKNAAKLSALFLSTA